MSENVIERLIEIEHRAKEETLRLEEEKRNLPVRIRKHTDAVRARIQVKSQDEIEALQKRVAAETKHRITAIEADCAERTRAMEALYNAQAKQWRNEIVAAVKRGRQS